MIENFELRLCFLLAVPEHQFPTIPILGRCPVCSACCDCEWLQERYDEALQNGSTTFDEIWGDAPNSLSKSVVLNRMESQRGEPWKA